MSDLLWFSIGAFVGFVLGVLIAACLAASHMAGMDDERAEAEIRRWADERAGGYQPISGQNGNLNEADPPKGGSGVNDKK